MKENNPAPKIPPPDKTSPGAEELFPLIHHNIHDVIWILDITTFQYKYISPSVYQLRGLTVEEAMAEPLQEALHEDDLNQIMNHINLRIKRYKEGDQSMKTLTGEYRQPHKNKDWIWAEITTTLINNQQGEVTEILGVSRRSDHPKTGNPWLKDTQSLFETVFNFTGTGIALINEDGRFINANSGFCKMVGYPLSQVLNKNFYDFLVKGDESCVEEIFEAVKKEENFEKQTEIRLKNLNGQIIWGLINITGIKSVNKEEIQWVMQIQETTARKKAEETIRVLNEDLKTKNSEMEQLVYVTSHDLRSPLVNIKGFSGELILSFEEIKKYLNAQDFAGLQSRLHAIDEEITESYDFISTSINKMDKLLRSLLDYSRLGKKMGKPSKISMDKLFAEIVKTYEYVIKEKHIKILITPLPGCWASEESINQAFSNLIGNAIKYLDDSRAGEITISGARKGAFSVYSIRDNGLGILKQHHQKIFELFFRLHPEKGDGEGLGLSHVKKIVELNNGRIYLESEPGKGTVFHVFLPAENKKKDAPAPFVPFRND